MALSIPEIIRQFKADVAMAVSTETIVLFCRSLGHTCIRSFRKPIYGLDIAPG